MRRRTRALAVAAAVVVAAALATGCAAGTGSRGAGPRRLPPDQRTAAALLKIATAFNNDYDRGDYGPVYARWDTRSQAIIARGDYIRRHQECPAGPQTSRTENASPGGRHGAWLVRYEIGGQQLTDYWFYTHRRWAFDLVLSNPQSVRLYRMPVREYLSFLGCAH
jgi:hypothetical protein